MTITMTARTCAVTTIMKVTITTNTMIATGTVIAAFHRGKRRSAYLSKRISPRVPAIRAVLRKTAAEVTAEMAEVVAGDVRDAEDVGGDDQITIVDPIEFSSAAGLCEAGSSLCCLRRRSFAGDFDAASRSPRTLASAPEEAGHGEAIS